MCSLFNISRFPLPQPKAYGHRLSYVDTRRMYDKMHSALQEALNKAGIEIPNDEFDVNLKSAERSEDTF